MEELECIEYEIINGYGEWVTVTHYEWIETEDQKDRMLDWLERRSDMSRINWDLSTEFDRKLKHKTFAHCSIYSATKEHPILRGE